MAARKEMLQASQRFDLLKAELYAYEQQHYEVTNLTSYERTALALEEIQQLMNDYKGIKTVLVHHELVQDTLEFSDRCLDLIVMLKNILRDSDRYNPSMREPTSQYGSSSSLASRTSSQRLRLPEITIPAFSGDPTEWTHFSEVFSSLVINNQHLDDVSKLHYLNSCLKDEPKVLIQNLSLSPSNFNTAWDILKQRYENIRLIVGSYVRNIMSAPNFKRTSSAELRALLDTFTSSIGALDSLSLTVPVQDLIIAQLLLDKLDSVTLSAWEAQAPVDSLPSLKDLITFLERQCKVLDFIVPSASQNASPSDTSSTKQNTSSSKPITSSMKPSRSFKCVYCSRDHSVFNCIDFLKLSPQQRCDKVFSKRLCKNCLKPYSRDHACTTANCKSCFARHHTLLCGANFNSNVRQTCVTVSDSPQSCHSNNACSTSYEKPSTPVTVSKSPQPDQSNDACFTGCGKPTTSYFDSVSASNRRFPAKSNNPVSSSSVPADKISLCATPVTGDSQCLLATASLYTPAPDGQPLPVTALLDAGSDVHLISQSLVNKLGLPVSDTTTIINGVSSVRTTSKHCVKLVLSSHNLQCKLDIKAVVVPTITPNLPAADIPTSAITVPINVSLADPKFNISKPIDLLLGASVFYDMLIPGQVQLGEGLPTLTNSKLGWLIAGPMPRLKKCPTVAHSNSISSDPFANSKVRVFPYREPPKFPTVVHSYFVGSNHATNVKPESTKVKELQKIPPAPSLTLEEESVINHSVTTTTPTTEGRYVDPVSSNQGSTDIISCDPTSESLVNCTQLTSSSFLKTIKVSSYMLCLIALFICSATRAVLTEVVSRLFIKTFISCSIHFAFISLLFTCQHVTYFIHCIAMFYVPYSMFCIATCIILCHSIVMFLCHCVLLSCFSATSISPRGTYLMRDASGQRGDPSH